MIPLGYFSDEPEGGKLQPAPCFRGTVECEALLVRGIWRGRLHDCMLAFIHSCLLINRLSTISPLYQLTQNYLRSTNLFCFFERWQT